MTGILNMVISTLSAVVKQLTSPHLARTGIAKGHGF